MELREIPIEGYERVLQCHDGPSGLQAIIAIHDTTSGPALGGLRMWPYTTRHHALRDALRLARGMTYQSAVAETGFGGGKAVVLGDAQRDKTTCLLRAMGRCVDIPTVSPLLTPAASRNVSLLQSLPTSIPYR